MTETNLLYSCILTPAPFKVNSFYIKRTRKNKRKIFANLYIVYKSHFCTFHPCAKQRNFINFVV